MELPTTLLNSPSNIQLKYTTQGYLRLNCSCFSGRFLLQLLLVFIFGILGMASLKLALTGVDYPSWLTKVMALLLGISFLGIALMSGRYALMHLRGSLKWHISEEGGTYQWYWGKWSFGQPQVFYWKEVESIYLAQPKKPDGDKDVFLVIKGTEKLFLRKFLSYQQMLYLQAFLSYLLEEYQEGNLQLIPDLGRHLLE